MNQLEFGFEPRLDWDSDVSWSCQSPAISESDRQYAGYPKGFTGHDWCSIHQPRKLLDDGTQVPCACGCHKKGER